MKNDVVIYISMVVLNKWTLYNTFNEKKKDLTKLRIMHAAFYFIKLDSTFIIPNPIFPSCFHFIPSNWGGPCSHVFI